MPVRLAEIASLAGVSLSTVSRVLNDKPLVHSETRRQVLAAIDTLGYDRPARLRPRVTGLVGLVLPELDNPYFGRFAQVLGHALSQRGFVLVIASHSLGGTHEDDYVRVLVEQGVSGLVLVSGIHALATTDPERYQRLVGAGLPLVLVNGPQDVRGAACLSTDDAQVIDLAVRHLTNMGHHRIGLALGQDRYTTVLRKHEAFVEAMRRHVGAHLDDAALEHLVVSNPYTVDGGAHAAQALLEVGVSAVVCASDLIALGVIRAARRRGLDVPGDLSVVGSDDSVLMAHTDPPLTTVRQPVEALAAAICQSLVEQVGGRTPPTAELLFSPELVVRGSTARVHART